MNLTACISFYREDPEWLERAVRSLAILGVTHLVAVDGGYAPFPDSTPVGSAEERVAIRQAADDVGIQAQLHVPLKVWATEMDKRSFMFERSEQFGADWHLVFDADYLVAEGFDLKPILEEFDKDVGILLLRHHVVHGSARTSTMMPMPMCFRALPGLRVVGHHANYETPNKRLWGAPEVAPNETIEGVIVDHLSAFRDPQRLQDQRTYYKRRQELGLERHP